MSNRAVWVLLAGVLGGVGCRSPLESKGAHPDPRAAIKACRAVLKNKPAKVTAERVRAVVAVCGKLLSEPACSKSWIVTYSTAASLEDMARAQHACHCAYCKRIKGHRLTFCSRYCEKGQQPPLLKKGTSPNQRSELLSEYLRQSRKLWDEIRHHEYGSQCSLHEEFAELIGQMIDEIRPFMVDKILAKAPRPEEPGPTPIIPPDDEPDVPAPSKPAQPATPEPLNLAVVMREGGLYIKSRYGAECPRGAPVGSKICFPTHGRLTDRTIALLQHHLWYLFASKYEDSMFYAESRDKHTITLIPAPTIKYEDIIRVLDAIREIPRDARNPAPNHPQPPGGCAMVYDKKAKAWKFAQGGDGRSVRETACMYYRVTLALGSS